MEWEGGREGGQSKICRKYFLGGGLVFGQWKNSEGISFLEDGGGGQKNFFEEMSENIFEMEFCLRKGV